MARRRKPNRMIRVVIGRMPYRDFPHEKGQFTVAQGVHDMDISTESVPKRVWTSLEGFGDLPVCVGDVDKVSTSIMPSGFVLHLEISSTERTIKWYAEL